VKKRFLGLLVLLIPLMAACGMADSAPNEVGLIYSGGLVEDKSFQGVLKPGATAKSVGMGSTVYKYRTDQRTYIFDHGSEAQAGVNVDQRSIDAPALQVVSKDSVRLTAPAQLYFTLHWGDEDVLRKFHEKLGFKTKAYDSDGWSAMLEQYFRPSLERAAETAALQHNWRDLYTSEETRKTFASDTIRQFKLNLVEVVGGNYFCGPKYDGENECDDFTLAVGKPTPPGPILEAIEATEKAREETIAQEQRNAQIAKQADGQRILIEQYGPYMAALIRLAESGKLQTIIVDEAGRATTPTK